MKSKNFLLFCIAVLSFSGVAQSQVFVSPRYRYYRVRPQRPLRQPHPIIPHFDPVVELSLGYGFPNIDKNYLPDYYQAYYNNSSMAGPFTGSINYRFSRFSSVGILVTHGTVQAPYYLFGSGTASPDFTVKLNNWAFMLNMVNYLSGSKNVSPYTRVAIGVNSWQQDFTDALGNKLSMQQIHLPDFAYQLGLGVNFKLSKNTGLFIEGGYGKYIVEGGLTFKL